MVDQVLSRLGPFGEEEVEASVQEASGYDLTAFEDKFGLGAHEEGADFEHPLGGGQADVSSPGLAEGSHEVAVREWIWGGEVDDTAEIFLRDEEFDGADEVGFVNPGDELAAGAGSAPEAVADETEKDVEDSARIGGRCAKERVAGFG